jgi:adenine-specific DNA-methyltransferase
MDRTDIKSDFCTTKATTAFENLINDINARYILVSYNNMGEKGNDRSNAKISETDIIRILSNRGQVKTFTTKYKPFTTGKSNIKQHEEMLYLCLCT